MVALASRTALGGEVGDTFNNKRITKVFSDGVYSWGAALVAALLTAVADKANRPDLAELADGTVVPVESNGLSYVVVNGAYEVEDFEISVADEAARDALTEMEVNQRAVLPDGGVDRWDGSAWIEGAAQMEVATHDELPDPSTVDVGTVYTVTADADDDLNGPHTAMGAAPGMPATYWDDGK